MKIKIGFGYDVHKLVENRKLILGGVEIQHDLGLLGHSDADVCVHAIMDAILGALALGDIGKLFPDTDMEYKDIDSMILLRRVYDVMVEKGFMIGNLDVVIAAQKPKLAPYIDTMRQRISNVLQTHIDNVSVKATTTEQLGFEGRKEGISAYCTVLLEEK